MLKQPDALTAWKSWPGSLWLVLTRREWLKEQSAPLEFGTPPQTRKLGGFFQTKKRMENTMACWAEERWDLLGESVYFPYSYQSARLQIFTSHILSQKTPLKSNFFVMLLKQTTATKKKKSSFHFIILWNYFIQCHLKVVRSQPDRLLWNHNLNFKNWSWGWISSKGENKPPAQQHISLLS